MALLLPDDVAVYQPLPPALWRVADAIGRIREMMAAGAGSRPLRDFLPGIAADGPDRALRRRAALASTLVAGLELAREGALTLEQETAFGPVLLSGAEAADADADPVQRTWR